MKGLLAGMVVWAVLAGPAVAERHLVRVHLEFIETAPEQLTELLGDDAGGSDQVLHGRMRALAREGKAKILETCVLTARPGEKASIESIREFIYPTEDYPDGLDAVAQGGNGPAPDDFQNLNWAWTRPTMWMMQQFETRNVGVTLEIEPLLWKEATLIDLRLAPEIVDLVRLDEWVEHRDRWGDASLRTPVFESLRLSTAITLETGKFAMLGTLTPTKSGGGLATRRRLVVFVKADVLRVAPRGKDEAE